MEAVKVIRNTTVQKKEDGIFLFIESMAGKVMFNLSALSIDPVTDQENEFIREVLEAWMAEQRDPAVDSNGGKLKN